MGFARAVVREVGVGYGGSPPDDLAALGDELQDLGDRIAELAAHIHAATHQLLVLIAEFDERGGWKLEGFRSCAHWLSFRTGVQLGTAREKVRTARALRTLPVASEAMSRGELSFAKTRALTRIATPENEDDLVDYARKGTAAQLETLVRGWDLRRDGEDEASVARTRIHKRSFSAIPSLDGMVEIRGQLTPEAGAMLMRAIEAAGDVLFADAGRIGPANGANPEVPSPEQLRADALMLLAERALQVGLGPGGRSGPTGEPDEAAHAAAPAHDSAPANDSAPIDDLSGTRPPVSRADRYQVILHVDESALSSDTRGPDETAPARSHLADGTRVSAATSRRVSCDSGVVRVRVSENGEPLDVGRRTRTIPPAIRRALDLRDRGCRFPGCGVRFTDGHHIQHWTDGGHTRLSNLVLLCHFHHRLVHEEGFRVVMEKDGQRGARAVGDGAAAPGAWPVGGGGPPAVTFYRPDGRMVSPFPLGTARPWDRMKAAIADAASAEPATTATPAARPDDSPTPPTLVLRNRAAGIKPDWRTASARWKTDADIDRWP